MKASFNLTGVKFGRLTPTARVGSKPNGAAIWSCACECGSTTTAIASELRSGHVRSCGCLLKDISRALLTRHGMSETSTYRSWCGMIDRCTREGHRWFKRYGGRGVTVCERWRDFAAFLADMGERPAGKTLDRYPNNDGNYEPGNCRWATPTAQTRNTSVSVLLTHQGVTASLPEWAERVGIPPSTLHSRIRRGWRVDKTLTTPSRVRLALLTNR